MGGKKICAWIREEPEEQLMAEPPENRKATTTLSSPTWEYLQKCLSAERKHLKKAR